MSDLETQRILDGIAETITTRAEDYQKAHNNLKTRALEIYYAFIGQFLEKERPEEEWKSHLYPKMMKPKIMAAWSQGIQAISGSKLIWTAEPRGINTLQSSTAAKAMLSEMHEQADKAELQKKLKKGSIDQYLYGSFFWQCPIVETRTKIQWERDLSSMGKIALAALGKGAWVERISDVDTPSCIQRNYFEMFPWPYSAEPQSGEGIVHRPFVDKYELASLRDEPGYFKDIIDELLKLGPGSPPTWSTEADMMGARGWSENNKRKGYDLIFHAGRLDAKDLRQVPGFEQETGKFAEVLAWVVNHSSGKKVIRLHANPSVGKYRPFMVSHYEQMPFESLGVGIGENSVDLAKSIGGSIRLFLDGKKMALPMMGINTSYFSGSTEIEIQPFKLWPFDQAGVNPKDALFPIQFNDITHSMVEFIEVLERLHDEITGIPKWTTGVDSKMLNKTATGISMIMNASSQLIRGSIENIYDDIIKPTGEQFYNWNMKRADRPDIKGDFIIGASGIATLMQKETLAKELLGLFSLVVNPAVYQNPYAMRLIRMVGDNMGINDVDSIMPNPDKMHEFAQGDPQAAAASLQPSAPGSVASPMVATVAGPGNGGM